MKTKGFQKAESFQQCSETKLLVQQRILGALSDFVEKKIAKQKTWGVNYFYLLIIQKCYNFFAKTFSSLPDIFAKIVYRNRFLLYKYSS